MSHYKNLETLRHAITTNLIETSGKDVKLKDGLIDMPISKMWSQVQYLQNHVLPQAKEKLGEESESYQFYKGLVDSLLWAINIQSRYDALQLKYSREKYQHHIVFENYLAMEKELLKYTTLEDLYTSMLAAGIEKATAKQVTT